MNNFNNKRTTKKGKVGEELVKRYLKSKGFMVYIPDTDAPHCVDFVIHKVGAKASWWNVEVKTKPIQKGYTTTGFNESHYQDYLTMLTGQHKLDTFVFFVDELEGVCYGQWISQLKDKQYRIIDAFGKDVRVWQRALMQEQFGLSPQDIQSIKQYN